MKILYICTIGLSAFLIFLVQPMMAKLLLPYLGGVPSVWNTSMLFYQFLLLLGYVYAHLSTQWLGARTQASVHIVLLIASLTLMPVVLYTDMDISPVTSPISWLLSALLISVGLPFFLLSSHAPMIQAWFSRTGHAQAANPYFLFSASNFGSFLALFSYPILFETQLEVSDQLISWSTLYGILVLLLASCAYIMYRRYTETALPEPQQHNQTEYNAATTPQKLRWVVLAFIPSSLMLGVTTYITTDIASMPLLWIIPLGLYLLSFVFAFATRMPFYRVSIALHLILVPMVLLFYALNLPRSIPLLCLHIVMFFVIAMVTHGQLAKEKPAAQHLTSFYLFVSLGGVLGGVFNAVLAPHLFDSVLEYPLIIWLSCFFRPVTSILNKHNLLKDIGYPLVLYAVIIVMFTTLQHMADTGICCSEESLRTLASYNVSYFKLLVIGTILTMALAVWHFRTRAIRFGTGMILLTLATQQLPSLDSNQAATPVVLEKHRNFFGIVEVIYDPSGPYHMLKHGITSHGIQLLDERRLSPVSYYAPLKQLLSIGTFNDANDPVAVIGLGIGTVACYGSPDQPFDFYEIDPAVQMVAEDTRYFTYLRDCPARSRVILGDGRLELGKQPDGHYTLLIVDAFNSDAIPMHLITREAMHLYFTTLADDGVLAFHITNQHLQLAPVLAALAEDQSLYGAHGSFTNADNFVLASEWVVLSRNRAIPEKLIENGWAALPTPITPVWTDSYSNILSVLK